MADLDDTEWSPDPLERLSELAAARKTIDFWILRAVEECRIAEAVSWQSIGDALGITRAAAWERFHD
jgi:hypothetical protein